MAPTMRGQKAPGAPEELAFDESSRQLRAELYAAVSTRRRFTNHLATVFVGAAFAFALVPLISVTLTTIVAGIGRFAPMFFASTMRGVYGGMDAGGIMHAVVGTVEITLGAAAISVPLGIFTGIYLVEYGRGTLARMVTFFVDVMTGIPSIVAGLFAFSVFTLLFGPALRIGIMGSVALAVLMTPVVVRATEEMLRIVPNELREASYALGVPKWLTVIKVVLRTAIAGITTGVMIAVARVIGETAPLLVTVGVLDSLNTNLFAGRMMTLPVYVYRQYHQGLVPCRPGDMSCIETINLDRAWAAALALIVIVMVLNLIARLIARFFAPKVR